MIVEGEQMVGYRIKHKPTGRFLKKVVRVMATGIFDILHTGHLHFLGEAKKLGNELVVVVARDSTAKKQKHEPIMSENMRLEMISALKIVDRAVLGYEDDMTGLSKN